MVEPCMSFTDVADTEGNQNMNVQINYVCS
jgi:hypothetical protein